MTAYLLDTNVLSELTKSRPNHGVLEWLRTADGTHVSVITLGEIEFGARRLMARDAARARGLLEWLDQVRGSYGNRVLDVDQTVMAAWSQIALVRSRPVMDALLAATAQAHGLTLVTRNVSDFADTGVPLHNPFAATASS